MDINTKHLREYLTEKFSVEDFSTFLFDYFPQVYSEITTEMRQGIRIQLLLEYCRNHNRFPELFTSLRYVHPDFDQEDFFEAFLKPIKKENDMLTEFGLSEPSEEPYRENKQSRK